MRCKFPGALTLIWNKLCELEQYLDEQFRILKSPNRNLITQQLGKGILAAATAHSIAPIHIWHSWHDAAVLDQQLRITKFRLPPQTSFTEALYFYLQERDSSLTKEILRTEQSWDQLGTALQYSELMQNIQRLSDWVEADMAFAAFVSYRTNRSIFKGNLIERTAAASATWLHTNKMPDRSKAGRWRWEVENIGNMHEKEFPDRLVEITTAWPGVDSSYKEGAVFRLEAWLFQIWPLVVHHEWTKREIVECAPKNWARWKELKARPDDFLRGLGLRGGARVGGRGVHRSRKAPPKQELAIDWAR